MAHPDGRISTQIWVRLILTLISDLTQPLIVFASYGYEIWLDLGTF